MLSFGLRGSFGRINNQVAQRGAVSASSDPTVKSPVNAYVRRSQFVAHTQFTLRSGAVDLMHGQCEQIVAAAADISQAWGMGAGVVKGASLRVLVSLCFAGDLEQGLGRWSVVCCEVDVVLSTTAAERGQFARKQGGRAMCARCT